MTSRIRAVRSREYGEGVTDVAVGGRVFGTARTFPLEDWRAALEISLTGHARGKLLLLP